jgi:quercetin dioxygenase-like cupin family protein
MKTNYLTREFFGSLIILTAFAALPAQVKAQTNPAESFFTGGTASVLRMATGDDMNCGVSKVTFPAGVRTIWHSHAGGQVIVVTSGTAWYQEKGKPKQIIAPGEAVVSHPGVMHWHGASPHAEMSHTVATPNLDRGGVTMAGPVSDKEYHGTN